MSPTTQPGWTSPTPSTPPAVRPWSKSWLLAIPHYLIAGFFIGGARSLVWRFSETTQISLGGGPEGLLVLFAAVTVLVRGTYPQGILDAVPGMNRWAIRVAYAALMTDLSAVPTRPGRRRPATHSTPRPPARVRHPLTPVPVPA